MHLKEHEVVTELGSNGYIILLCKEGESGTVVFRAMHVPLASRNITTTEQIDTVQMK